MFVCILHIDLSRPWYMTQNCALSIGERILPLLVCICQKQYMNVPTLHQYMLQTVTCMLMFIVSLFPLMQCIAQIAPHLALTLLPAVQCILILTLLPAVQCILTLTLLPRCAVYADTDSAPRCAVYADTDCSPPLCSVC